MGWLAVPAKDRLPAMMPSSIRGVPQTFSNLRRLMDVDHIILGMVQNQPDAVTQAVLHVKLGFLNQS